MNGANTSKEQPTLEVPTPPTLPTLTESTANTSPGVLADLPEALATLKGLERVEIDEDELVFSTPTRLEPRYNAKTGKLRGIAWRERNKDRKGVWYVGVRSEGQRKRQWEELRIAFDRTANTSGEALEGRNEPGTSVGS